MRDRVGRRNIRPRGLTPKVRPNVTLAVAVEKMTQQPSIQIRRTEQPVGNRKGEIHVFFHHQS